MTDRVYNVLFLCTGNSARSILGEAILNKDDEGRFHAYSAGSRPKGDVHPLAIKELGALGYSTENLSSKAGTCFQVPTPLRWISFSLSAITLPEKPVLSGSAIR